MGGVGCGFGTPSGRLRRWSRAPEGSGAAAEHVEKLLLLGCMLLPTGCCREGKLSRPSVMPVFFLSVTAWTSAGANLTY